jgi:tight adherence protein C
VRTLLAVGFAVAVFVLVPLIITLSSSMLWLGVIVGGIAGYVGPSMYLDRRIARRRDEHRAGFPDFMDLLVVCADSGLSMEASLERVGRELGESYPSLCTNIHMANLEIRAGRSRCFSSSFCCRSSCASTPATIEHTAVSISAAHS